MRMSVGTGPGLTRDDTPISSWSERHVEAMGSRATLIAGDGPLGLLDWACHELERLEQCWSRFRPGSELDELNQSEGRWFPMSDTLALAIDRAVDLHWLTGGLFDPTVHDRLVQLGYDRTFRKLAPVTDRPVEPGRPCPGPLGIERDGHHLRLPHGVRLDLGGVGKGLAADLLAEGLIERGARSACISLGGDIRAAGLTPDGLGWQVPIEDPFGSDSVMGSVPVAESAIVTSTTLIRTWRRGGKVLHHLVDPRTGDPSSSGIVAAVVMAPEGWLAEGLAKAALVAGVDRGTTLLEGSDVAGWLACADGSILATAAAPELRSKQDAN